MASSKPYGKLPSKASSSIKPFTLNFPDSDIKQMHDLLKLTPIAAPIYENSLPDNDRHLGVRRDWLLEAKRVWETDFDWRNCEKHINSFPNFKTTIKDKKGDFDIHFAALFSEAPDAVPVVLLHGWPGSFLEFLPLLGLFREKYTPQDLKYHVIVPSLPGYTLSGGQPVSEDLDPGDAARLMNTLMCELGFEDGYIAQGGDVGSRVARVMGVEHEACKAVHLNMCMIPEPKGIDPSTISTKEKTGLERGQKWRATGIAYAMEQATRPATLGFVLNSNPIALLCWIGEKFLDWTDADPSINTILEATTLYWLTRCAHSNLWSYRHGSIKAFMPSSTYKGPEHPDMYIKVPFGYSYFPAELVPAPVAWAKTTGNLVWSNIHEKGGHFAALECPQEMLADLEGFVGEVWVR